MTPPVAAPAPHSLAHRPLLLIPSYNSGPKLLETVAGARAACTPVWVVVDGSTDGSDATLDGMEAADPGLRVLRLPVNSGKGAAVLHGLLAARQDGFTHVLTMDADGQHPADRIADFFAASAARPEAMILGRPIFDASAPLLRVRGRKISNWWAKVETLGGVDGDSLFGFRVYPVGALIAVMQSSRWMRRFDFDPEAAIRLSWRGVPAVNIDAQVRYFTPNEGGVSHFRYGRDNVLLTWMHGRLLVGAILRLPLLAWRATRRRAG